MKNTKVVLTVALLTSGNGLFTSMRTDENGNRDETTVNQAWTSAVYNGTAADPNCQNWTSNSSSDIGLYGFIDSNIQNGWAAFPSGPRTASCDNHYHLYCFQQ